MGTLYLVSTPIGNRDDITLRALQALGEAALVVAEDTRHSGRLLKHFEIDKPLLSLHEHNEQARIPQILAALDRGDVALISDAGTPTLSDPGFALARAAIAAGFTLTPIPGASALLAALVASGLPPDRFLFLGFPPRKTKARSALLQTLAAEPGTLIFYESPRRLRALLQDAAAAFGPDRPAVVARELTKRYETIWRGTIAGALAAFAEAPPGEIVVLFGGAPASTPDLIPAEVAESLQTLLENGVSLAVAARVVAGLTGIGRSQIYRLGLDLQAESGS